MRKLLFLIGSLDYGGAARQLTLLAGGLPRERFDVRVAVLGADAPWVRSLRAAGVPVDVLGWKRAFDLVPLLSLRRLIGDFRPDALHAWGPKALRASVLAGGRGRLFAGALIPPDGRVGPLDRWLIRRVDRVVAFSGAEADGYRRLGVPAWQLTQLPRGVPPPNAVAGREDVGPPSLPAGARVVLGIGPLEPHKGFPEAVWALDILSYLYDDLHLVLAGGGSDRARVEAFARGAGLGSRVHFTGPCPDLGPLLARAELVWVPSLRAGGTCAALEAMAAGRPVVASRVPGPGEVVIDGVTGFLVSPGDKAGLARHTRTLLDDAGLRARLGAAAREHAGGFGTARLAGQAARLYQEGPGAAQKTAIPS